MVFQHVLLNRAINSYPSVTLRASLVLEKTFLKNCCLVMTIVKYDLLELSQIWYSKVLSKQGEGGSNKQGLEICVKFNKRGRRVGISGGSGGGGVRKWLIGYLSV